MREPLYLYLICKLSIWGCAKCMCIFSQYQIQRQDFCKLLCNIGVLGTKSFHQHFLRMKDPENMALGHLHYPFHGSELFFFLTFCFSNQWTVRLCLVPKKLLRKEKKCKEKWFFYVWLSYEKYKKKSNIIKTN